MYECSKGGIVVYTYIQPRTRSIYVCYVLRTELVLKKGHCDELGCSPNEIDGYTHDQNDAGKNEKYLFELASYTHEFLWLHESLDNSKIYYLIYYRFYYIDILDAIHNFKFVYVENWELTCACCVCEREIYLYTQLKAMPIRFEIFFISMVIVTLSTCSYIY